MVFRQKIFESFRERLGDSQEKQIEVDEQKELAELAESPSGKRESKSKRESRVSKKPESRTPSTQTSSRPTSIPTTPQVSHKTQPAQKYTPAVVRKISLTITHKAAKQPPSKPLQKSAPLSKTAKKHSRSKPGGFQFQNLEDTQKTTKNYDAKKGLNRISGVVDVPPPTPRKNEGDFKKGLSRISGVADVTHPTARKKASETPKVEKFAFQKKSEEVVGSKRSPETPGSTSATKKAKVEEFATKKPDEQKNLVSKVSKEPATKIFKDFKVPNKVDVKVSKVTKESRKKGEPRSRNKIDTLHLFNPEGDSEDSASE